jgi:tetratricopeptide (TPR) repeat protein
LSDASIPRRAYVTLSPVRFLGFFLLVFALLSLLRMVPVIGGLFQIPLLGFFLAAMIVSMVAARLGTQVVSNRKFSDEIKRLGTVDTPHTLGKLGRMLEMSGKHAKAVEPLQQAIAGEPEMVEWHYRLGCAQLGLRDFAQAIKHLEDARQLDEEHAYGGVLLALAEAQRLGGEGQAALASLERYEVLQGPTPESAFRRGQVHTKLKDSQRARAALDEVGQLAAQQPKYQRSDGRRWAAKALFAKLFA